MVDCSLPSSFSGRWYQTQTRRVFKCVKVLFPFPRGHVSDSIRFFFGEERFYFYFEVSNRYSEVWEFQNMTNSAAWWMILWIDWLTNLFMSLQFDRCFLSWWIHSLKDFLHFIWGLFRCYCSDVFVTKKRHCVARGDGDEFHAFGVTGADLMRLNVSFHLNKVVKSPNGICQES